MTRRSVASELARLARAVEVGFAEQRGRDQLLAQRLEQSERQGKGHHQRLERLERRQWPLPVVTVVAVVASAVAAVLLLARP